MFNYEQEEENELEEKEKEEEEDNKKKKEQLQFMITSICQALQRVILIITNFYKESAIIMGEETKAQW